MDTRDCCEVLREYAAYAASNHHSMQSRGEWLSGRDQHAQLIVQIATVTYQGGTLNRGRDALLEAKVSGFTDNERRLAAEYCRELMSRRAPTPLADELERCVQ